MKSLFIVSAIAAGIVMSAPANADAAEVAVGVTASNGNVAGHLTLVDHRRGYVRDHRRHRRFRCQNWRRAHRRLHRRFDHVRFQRRLYNRRGHKVFIARARNHRGYPVRVRYNACTRRVTRVTPLRRHWRDHRRDGRYRDGRYHERRNWRP